MQLVNRVLNKEVSYENVDGGITFRSLGQIKAERVIDPQGEQAHPKRWIKDCWSDYHGRYVPLGFKTQWAFAQKIYDVCKAKNVSPAVFVPRIPKEPRKGMWAFLNGAMGSTENPGWLELKENQESFDQWLRRIN